MNNPIKIEGQTPKERSESVMKLLEAGVREVFTSSRYREFLTLMSKFRKYSANNNMMILLQFPEATQVAGIHTWNSMGRHVIPGSEAIRILAPAYYKKEIQMDLLDGSGKPVLDETTGQPKQIKKEIEIKTFKLVSVFDLSQTEGKPLEHIASELSGTHHNAKELFEAIKVISECPIVIQPLQGTVKGYYSPSEQLIVIRSKMSGDHTLKTAVHELVHCRLHDPTKQTDSDSDSRDRRLAEVQAESIAFVVLEHFGIKTDEYSFGYIAGWSSNEELKELHKSLNVIQHEANLIIEAVEAQLVKAIAADPQLVGAC